MLNAHTVQGSHGDVFTYLHGDLDAAASHCHMPCDVGPDSLVFVSDRAQLATARERGAAILVVQRDLADQLVATDAAFGCSFSVKTVSMGMAVLLKHFDRKRERFAQWGERHPTAVVHASATIGAGVLLGPYCVIGANAIAVYMARSLFDFHHIGDIFVGGLARNLKEWMTGDSAALAARLGQFIRDFAAFGVIWLVCLFLYVKRTFIRV